MDESLCTSIDQVIEAVRAELYERMPRWGEARTPTEVFDCELELQTLLNWLQSLLVRAVLEAIHRDEAFVAECEEQAVQQCVGRIRQYRLAPVRTLGGNQVLVRTPHALCEEDTFRRPKGEQSHRGVGLYPVLRRLGVVRGATPSYLAEVTRQLVDGPSGAEARERLSRRGIERGQNALWYRLRDLGSIALWQRDMDVDDVGQSSVRRPAVLAGKRVVVSLDGGRARIRNDMATDNQARPKRYGTGECELKLYVVYTIDHTGRKERDGEVFYDGTLRATGHIFELLKLCLHRLGVVEADEVIAIGDGAAWIWKGVAVLKETLETDRLQLVEIVDWAHAVSKLTEPARIGVGDSGERHEWLKQARKLLREGQISELVTALHALDQSQDAERVIHRAAEYFATHRARMQYSQFEARGLPIGSGIVESGVRRLINLRLAGGSTYWRPETAEALLHLRCQAKTGRWDEYVKSVLSRWAADMSVPLARVHQVGESIRSDYLESHPPGDVSGVQREAILWAQDLLRAGKALILDTETTGLEADDEVVELAVIDLRGSVLFETLIRPTRPVSAGAYAVNHIGETRLAGAPRFPEVHCSVEKLLRDRHVVAYNAEFDRQLLVQTCRKYGLPPIRAAGWSCAMEEYAHFLGRQAARARFQRTTLASACAQQGISADRTHNAVQDCLLTLELIEAIAASRDEDGCD